MLLYKKLQGDKFVDVPATELATCEEPFVLFLGGLEHFNGLGMGKTLAGILRDLSRPAPGAEPLPVYMPVRPVVDIFDVETKMFSFIKKEEISDETRELFDAVFLPQSIKKEATASPEQAEELFSRYFRRLNMISYSYGTSLTQQIERLFDAHIKSAPKYAAALEKSLAHVGVVNIGPVANPYDRQGRRYGLETKAFSRPQNLFSQLFFYKSNDKVMLDKIGKSLVFKQKGAIVGHGNNKLGFICDFEGDEWLRRIGKGTYPGGKSFTRLDYAFNHEAHDLRVYTNRLSLKHEMLTFPSVVISDQLHAATQQMVKESQDPLRKPRTFAGDAVKYFQTPDLKRETVSRFRALRDQFNEAVKDYSQASPSQAFRIVEAQMKKVQKMTVNRSRNPDCPAL